MSDHVHWLLGCKVKAGQLDALKSLMAEMVEATQTNEPGTLNYEWELSEDEGSLHIYERYVDSASVMIHMGSFGANFAGRFLATAEPTFLYVYGKPNDEVRKTLDPLGALYLNNIGGFSR